MTNSSNANNLQKQSFIEAANELGTDDDPAAFDALFGKLVPPITPKQPIAKTEEKSNSDTA